MVCRGKVWKNILIASGITLASTLPLKTNFPSKTPLEDRKPPIVQVAQLRAEPEKEDTVYLPQAVIDSAFGWKYGKVEEFTSIALDSVKSLTRARPLFIDIGDGWKLRISVLGGSPSGGPGGPWGHASIEVLYNGKEVGFATLTSVKGDFTATCKGFEEALAKKEVRFIKYTDNDGHNCLVVKQNRKAVKIFYAGIKGYGLIWISDDNSPLSIGEIGFLPSDEGKNGKFLTVLVDINGDGIVGIAISNRDKWFSEEMKFAKK